MKLTRFPSRAPILNDEFKTFDSFIEQSLAPFQQLLSGASHNGAQIAADVIENENQFVIRLELPGVKRDDIDVQFNNQKLSINVEQSADNDESKVSLTRTFNVNQSVAADQISAKLEDGILTLVLPKAEEAKPRSIQID